MSQQNVDRTSDFIEAYNRRDFDAAVEHFDPEIEWVLPAHQRSDSCIGPRAIIRFWEGLDETMEELRLDPQEFVDAGDRVAVRLRYYGRGKGSGAEIETEMYHQVTTFRDGTMVRIEYVTSWAEALAAAGVGERETSSGPDVEAAVRAIDAWNRRDLSGFLDEWHADAQWRPAFPQGTEGAGAVFRGHYEIRQAWDNVRSAWAEYRLEVEDARVVGETLLVLGHLYARGARSAVEIDSPWSAVVRFRDGRVARAWDWLDHAHALEAVGLQEVPGEGRMSP